jgi:hypothetical protein
MKTKQVALAGILALSSLTSAALAQSTTNVYVNSENGTVTSGVIKECTTGWLFKNVNPFISGGNIDPFPPDGVPWIGIFDIDGSQVELQVTWYENNSFKYEFHPLRPGLMTKIGVENNSDKIIYEYVSPVTSDTGLNVLETGDAPKANHIDVCLLPVDTTPPSISFNSPPTPVEGASVSGVVIIEVTVSDPSGVDRDSVAISIAGESFPMVCTPATPGATEYVCSHVWITADYATGLYELAVVASDLAEPTRNVTVEPKTIQLEAVRLFTDCFGTLGDAGDLDPLNPSEPNYAGGCMPTKEMRVQVPPDTLNCAGPDPQLTCYIAGTVLKPDPDKVIDLYAEKDPDTDERLCPAAAPGHCTGGFPDCRMAPVDPNNLAGPWYPKDKQDLNVFTELGLLDQTQYDGVLAAVQAAYPTGSELPVPVDLNKALVLDQDTYGANGCFVVTQHFKGYIPDGGGAGGTELNVLYPTWPQNPATGLFFIKSHFPQSVLPEAQVAECYDEVSNPDLQVTAGAGYMPLFQSADDTGYVSMRTMGCVNPLLKSSRNNGFDVSNIIVSTAGLDHLDTATNPVEVLTFMYQENEEDFARLFALIDIINRDSLLLSGNFNRDVQSPINQAKRRFDNFNPKSLQQSIDSLWEAVDGIRTKTTYLVTEANPPGEMLSVTYHLIWDLGLLRDELNRVEALP